MKKAQMKSLSILMIASGLFVMPQAWAQDPPPPALFNTGGRHSSQGEEFINFQNGRSLRMLKTPGGYEIGIVEDKGSATVLMQALQIQAVSGFQENANSTAPFRKISVINSANQLESVRSWFFIETEQGPTLLRYVGPGESPFVLIHFPKLEGDLVKVSSTKIKLGSGVYNYALSMENSKGQGVTYFADSNTGTGAKLFDHYVQLSEDKTGGSNLALYDGQVHVTGQGHQVSIEQLKEHLRSFPVSRMTPSKQPAVLSTQRPLAQTAYQQVSQEKIQPSGGDAGHVISRITSMMEQSVHPIMPNHSGSSAPTGATQNSSVAEAQDGSEQLPSGSQQIELDYNGHRYQMYISTDRSRPGTYLRRESDSLTVKVSAQEVPLAPANGDKRIAVRVEDGILKHPALIRQIDLDAFEMETKFKPRTESKKDVEWLENQFQDARNDGSLVIKPVSERHETVQTVLANALKANRSSTILTGEAGDAMMILREAARNLPRTWDFRVLAADVIGSDTSVAGQLEEKMKQIRSAIGSKPVIWLAENFDSLKGIGVSQGNPKDVLEFLRSDLRDGYMKVLGTGSSEFFSRLTDRALIQSLQTVDMTPLTDKAAFESMKEWLNAQPDLPVPSDQYLMQVMSIAKKFNLVDDEPVRSLNMLERVMAILERKKMLNADGFTADVLGLAAREEYHVDPSLRDVQMMRLRLREFPAKMSEAIMGHEKLISDAYIGTKKGLAGLSNGRGPIFSMFIDGPPGTGKTEFATSYAQSLGLRLVTIEMSQFKGGDQATIDRFMQKVGTEAARDSFTVLLFDEIEKSSIEVQNAMLTAMSRERFTYAVDGKMHRQSLSNAIVFGTSNSAGDDVAAYFRGLTDDQREQSSVELTSGYFEQRRMEDFEDLIVQKVSRPLFDRFMLKEVAFPPSLTTMKKILTMKLNGVRKDVQAKMNFVPKFVGADQFIEGTARLAISQGWSTRTTIEHLEGHANDKASDMIFEDYNHGQEYELQLAHNGPHATNAMTCSKALIHH